ncbi:MAG: non-homologous end-joining DNA ligase [Nakamurella sp.]
MVEWPTVRTVGGQEFKVTTPERVFYPAAGTTKADVIDYYLAIADVMLPHLAGRPVTRRRWTDGVGGPEFYAKDVEPGTPEWMRTVQIVHGSGPKFYPVIDSAAGLGWLGQVGALEVHVPQWGVPPADGPSTATSTGSQRHPDRVVFDLDPGPGTGLPECARVALYLRDRLGALGERMVPVTSGSKGLHLYVPMDTEITSEEASGWACLAAEQVEKAIPELVVSRMSKALRSNKVFIDWSQNNGKKNTISPYSMRGREHPTVAAPRTWEEIEAPRLEHLDYREVLERVAAGLDPMSTLVREEPIVLSAAVGAEQVAPAPADPRRAPRATVRTASRSAIAPIDALRLMPKVAPPEPRKPRTPRRAAVKEPSPPKEPTPQKEPNPTGTLPSELAGPVDLALAKAVEEVPGPFALPGGSRYELKWDGYRGAMIRRAKDARLWSRQRNDMTTQFPELTAAAESWPPGTVVDGEVVIWNGAQLDFDLLQKRLAVGAAKVAAQVRSNPASFVAFDLIAYAGEDLRRESFTRRRELLEALAADWSPPLTLSPVTDDVEKARGWMESYRPAGIEGLVVKGAASRYEPGARRWLKHKTRETTEVIVGAVTGPIGRPDTVVAGLYRDGRLIIAGRSVPLKSAQSRSLAEVLEPAGTDHPWPDTILSSKFGSSSDRTTLTKVDPTVVAEVSVDTAMQGGVWRHPLRFLRHRPDLTEADLPELD